MQNRIQPYVDTLAGSPHPARVFIAFYLYLKNVTNTFKNYVID